MLDMDSLLPRGLLALEEKDTVFGLIGKLPASPHLIWMITLPRLILKELPILMMEIGIWFMACVMETPPEFMLMESKKTPQIFLDWAVLMILTRILCLALTAITQSRILFVASSTMSVFTTARCRRMKSNGFTKSERR